MSFITCPKCWQMNAAGSSSCSRCRYDLSDVGPVAVEARPNPPALPVSRSPARAQDLLRQLDRTQTRKTSKHRDKAIMIGILILSFVLVLVFTGADAALMLLDMIFDILRRL
ncbi:MAG: hypothetical protein KDE59_08675 [Anaerolineales bacterium]|nr:hypothetical protein [Anaerolineales bacterium]MCB8960938.1 hypothetical protein [Ardenticatenales bacterium]